jgi:hypothetical protein
MDRAPDRANETALTPCNLKDTAALWGADGWWSVLAEQGPPPAGPVREPRQERGAAPFVATRRRY